MARCKQRRHHRHWVRLGAFIRKKQIEKDWKGKIDDINLKDLQAVSGLKGEAAKRKIHSLRHLSIPFSVAQDVFLTSVLSNQAKVTVKVFPGAEELPADAQAMLLSLVFQSWGPRLRGGQPPGDAGRQSPCANRRPASHRPPNPLHEKTLGRKGFAGAAHPAGQRGRNH